MNSRAPSRRKRASPSRARALEVERSVFTFTVAAEETVRGYGEYLPLDWQQSTAGRWGIVKRFPLGPVAGISPFNFPLNLVAHKVAPAIAAGCPIVLKPAPQTPLSALLLAEVIQQAGWPDGGFNVLPLSNEDAGLLVTDERIKLISFTGSAAVGWTIKANAGKKKVVLEFGGNSGVIVHSDADLAYAAEPLVTGGFAYAGQSCISVQRILVEQSVCGKFIELLVEGVSKLKVGDPLDDTSRRRAAHPRERRHPRPSTGCRKPWAAARACFAADIARARIFEPTVLTGTKPNMKVNCQEIFAPVVTVEPYTDFASALKQINSSPYGLQAGIFTRDAKLIFDAYKNLKLAA